MPRPARPVCVTTTTHRTPEGFPSLPRRLTGPVGRGACRAGGSGSSAWITVVSVVRCRCGHRARRDTVGRPRNYITPDGDGSRVSKPGPVARLADEGPGRGPPLHEEKSDDTVPAQRLPAGRPGTGPGGHRTDRPRGRRGQPGPARRRRLGLL